MPILGSYSFAGLHTITPILGVAAAPSAFLTTSDSTYNDPLLATIRITSLDKSNIYYTYNSFSPTITNPTIYMNVNLSLSHHGTFELQIEDSDKTLDIAHIKNGARVYISLGKTEATKTAVLSGMIRTVGYNRGCEQNLLYNLSGFGSAIRFNERILDILIEPATLGDGVTLDTTDSHFFADQVVDDSIDDTTFYPKGTPWAKVEGTGGYGYIDSSTTQDDSPIEDFMPGVIQRFGEIEDIHTQVEGYTGARVYVNPDDKVQLQPIQTPLSQNTGFVITTNVQPTLDPANTTMYISDEDYSYTESISKDAGYSNSLFGILPATTVPDVSTNSDMFLYQENKNTEAAVRFRPITSPNWVIYATVEAVGMDNVDDEDTVKAAWRMCEDDNGVPKNSGGIMDVRYMFPNEFYSTGKGGSQTIEVFRDSDIDLDENTYYWLIFSSFNSSPSQYWRWYYKENAGNRDFNVSAAAPAGTTSASDGGSGWALATNKDFGFIQARFKSEPYNILDHQAVKKNILIESVTPSFPQQIANKAAASKYFLGLIQSSARPRTVFDFSSLTVPNKPPLPGDGAIIIDSRFNYSTSGNPVVAGQISDINYSMGIKDGGSSPSSKGMNSLSLSVVGYPRGY